MTYRIELYAGGRQKDGKVTKPHLDRCLSIVKQHFNSFTFEIVGGYWLDRKIQNVKVTILNDNLNPIKNLSKQLKEVLEQKYILVTWQKTNTAFY